MEARRTSLLHLRWNSVDIQAGQFRNWMIMSSLPLRRSISDMKFTSHCQLLFVGIYSAIGTIVTLALFILLIVIVVILWRRRKRSMNSDRECVWSSLFLPVFAFNKTVIGKCMLYMPVCVLVMLLCSTGKHTTHVYRCLELRNTPTSTVKADPRKISGPVVGVAP